MVKTIGEAAYLDGIGGLMNPPSTISACREIRFVIARRPKADVAIQ